MIQEFVDRFMERKETLEEELALKHPDDYEDLVQAVIKLISDGYGGPDPENIHTINDGDWQGTLVFIIPEVGYQPDDYWYVKVYYGSCSGCDTLESIRTYTDIPDKEQVDQYMTLALHIIQGLKPMQEH